MVKGTLLEKRPQDRDLNVVSQEPSQDVEGMFPDQRASLCKGPEEEMQLAYLKKMKGVVWLQDSDQK